MRRKLLVAAVIAIPLATVGGLRLSAQNQPNRPDCPGNVLNFTNTFAYDEDGNVVHYENQQILPAAEAGYATEEDAVRAEADAGVNQYDDTRKSADRHEVRKGGRTAAVFHVTQFKNGRYAVAGGAVCAEDVKKPPKRSQR